MQFLIRPNFDYKSLEKNHSNNNTFSDKLSSKNFINSYKNETIENIENQTIHYDNEFINSQNLHNDTLNSKELINLSNSFFSPPIFLLKPKNIEFIPDYFNCSNTENKNIMVSDLDINLETPSIKTKKKKSKINIKITDNNNDFKKELEKTLREYLEKKQNIVFNTEPSSEKRYDDIKQKFSYENNNKITINYCNPKQKFEKIENNLIMQSPKNDLCLTIMNTSSLKPPTKHKAIYKTEQKTNNKKCNVYQIVKDNNEMQYNSSFKKKNFQRANSSNLKSMITKKSFVTNNSLTNCSSTYEKERNIPIFYNNNLDLIKCNDVKKNNSKSAVRNKIQCNIRNQIFQNFSLKNKEKFLVNKIPINIKKNKNFINNSNKYINNNITVKKENCKNNLNNKLKKDKISLIQNAYDSYIGNNISKSSKNKFCNNEKITKKNYLKTEHKNSRNPISSLTLKIVDKKINNNLKNKKDMKQKII